MSAEPHKENEHEYTRSDNSRAGVLSGRSSAQNEYNAVKCEMEEDKDEPSKREDDKTNRGDDKRDAQRRSIPSGNNPKQQQHQQHKINVKQKQSSRYSYPSKGPGFPPLMSSDGSVCNNSVNGNSSSSNNNNNSARPHYPNGGQMSRGFQAPPHYVYHGSGNPYGPPPPHYPPPHHHHPMQPHMQPYMNHQYGGPPMNGRPQLAYHPHPPPPHSHYPPPHYQGMPMHYGPHPGMMPPSYPRNDSDNVSLSSKGSRNSKKKRTIDGVHETNLNPPYTFRRTDSTCSSTSTVTAGNNTSADTYLTDDSPRRKDRSDELPPMNMDSMGFDDDKSRYRSRSRLHRRDLSADASTTSSLSVGGFSLSSYEGRRADEKSVSDAMPLIKSSPKRHKSDSLRVDTVIPGVAVDDDQAKFDALAMEAPTMPTSTTSSSSGASRDRNLFLSLSTSPIAAQVDVDQTPISKNTKKEDHVPDSNVSSIFKMKRMVLPKLETVPSATDSRPSETPTPPAHGELADSNMNNDEQSMLNRHLRGQSFTPLPHLGNSAGGNGSSNNSPSQTTITAAMNINHQLSWSIAGDTHSLGDLEDWDDDGKKNAEVKVARPGSACSAETRNMMISPHDFQLWKDDHEFADQAISGTTTPLPAFFDQPEGSENHMDYDRPSRKEREEHSRHEQYDMHNRRHLHRYPPSSWPKHHDMPDKMMHMGPPTPMYASSSDFRDDVVYSARSPDMDRRQDMEYYPSHSNMHHGHHMGHEDRIRNLRGRLPPGHYMPPMPLHIHPGMATHLPMTSPMGLGPGKAGMWSPHGGMPPMASPHHLASPLNSMSQSKRKCVSLKPPIPSKFQGDMEKAKNAQVPEFTNLVNFPAHISQKQAVNLPDGMRCCVMCGQACPCSVGGKAKKGAKKGDKSDASLTTRSNNGQDLAGDKNNGYAIIPSQNKGLCTLCDVNVWIVVQSGLEIKWCKGCKNFRPWASFGDKGLATKCLRCRERQREKYALQKEEKEKSRMCKAAKEKS